MTGFTLHLQATGQYERIDGVTSFVGEDASGRFGLLPHHERLVTTLAAGLSRFRVQGGPWQYLALPGSVLHFAGNELFISTRRYLRGDDYHRLAGQLEAQLLAEEQALADLKGSVHRLEEAMLRRLRELGREDLGREDL